MCFKNAAIWLTPFHRPYGNYRNGQPHICTHCTIISRDRWFPFHLAFLRWLLGQLKQQLINTEHPVLPRELGCQSLWLVSCASGSFYTQPQNSLLLKSGIEKKNETRVIGKACSNHPNLIYMTWYFLIWGKGMKQKQFIGELEKILSNS